MALAISQLTGFLAGGGPIDPPSISWVDGDSASPGDSWSPTVTLGAVAEGATRTMIVGVAVTSNNDATGPSISGTLGGVSLTARQTHLITAAGGPPPSTNDPPTNDEFGYLWIATADVPTGTSATLALTGTLTGDINTWSVSVWRAVGLSSAVPGTTPDGDNTGLTLVVPANGFGLVIGCKIGGSGSFSSYSGSGMTTDYNNNHIAAGSKTAAGSVAHQAAGVSIHAGATWTFV
jgi:hypothetical protein